MIKYRGSLIMLIAIVCFVSCEDDDNDNGEGQNNLPVIDNFNPESGIAGSEVVLEGKNFGLAPEILFNGKTASMVSMSDSRATVKVPMGATTGKIELRTGDHVVSSSKDFIVYQNPEMDSFEPKQAPIGEIVVITGQHFSDHYAGNHVTINGMVAGVLSAAADRLEIVVPWGCTSGKIEITVNELKATSAEDLTVSPKNEWIPIEQFSGLGCVDNVSFTIAGKAYVCAGKGTNGNRRDLWEYDILSKTWTRKADYPGSGTIDMVGFVVHGKAYVGTGEAVGRKKDFWEYDPVTNAWTRKDDFPDGGRSRMIGFSLGSKGYAGMGLKGETPLKQKDFWEFDPGKPSGQQWTRLSDVGGPAYNPGLTGFRGSAFTSETKGYLLISATGITVPLWEYEPSTDTWIEKNPLPENVTSAHPAYWMSDRCYVVSAHKFWMYDLATDQWTKKKDFPGEVVWATAFRIGLRAYVGLGYYSDDFTYPQRFYRYLPD